MAVPYQRNFHYICVSNWQVQATYASLLFLGIGQSNISLTLVGSARRRRLPMKQLRKGISSAPKMQ